jgi:GTPase SAR1 family protein
MPTTLDYKPTIGLNSSSFYNSATKYEGNRNNLWVWDLGGRANLRKIWESYFPDAHGMMYVLDDRIIEGM